MKLRFSLAGFMVLLVFFLAACGQNDIKDAVTWPIKDFKAVNQENKSFGLNNLKGKVWIADFMFTSCADVCPPMTSNLLKLQERVKKEGLKDVEIVSFSVDPTVDKPETLTKYANQFHVDFNNWTFLTGYSQAFIEKFALKNFKAFVKKPENGSQVVHQTTFFLVDQKGNVKKTYSGLQDVPYDEIIHDIKALQ